MVISEIVVSLRQKYKIAMTQENRDELMQLLKQHKDLGISEQIDYNKFYLYSIITHSKEVSIMLQLEISQQLMANLES